MSVFDSIFTILTDTGLAIEFASLISHFLCFLLAMLLIVIFVFFFYLIGCLIYKKFGD